MQLHKYIIQYCSLWNLRCEIFKIYNFLLKLYMYIYIINHFHYSKYRVCFGKQSKLSKFWLFETRDATLAHFIKLCINCMHVVSSLAIQKQFCRYNFPKATSFLWVRMCCIGCTAMYSINQVVYFKLLYICCYEFRLRNTWCVMSQGIQNYTESCAVTINNNCIQAER